MEYGDLQSPYRVTREVDGGGTATLYSYDEYGQMTSRVEAFATPLERETTWEYHDVYPALPVQREEPSTYPTATKRTVWSYDARGLAQSRTEEGIESGEAYAYTTRFTHTAEGMRASVDPPGFEVPGQLDISTMTYDPARGGQVAASRTDPVIGTTTYGYDPFNNQNTTTDVNGVVQRSTYDAMDRVTSIVHEGADPSESLITNYVYDTFGDLDYIVLPEGNVIDYEYDPLGRMISIERRPDLTARGQRTLFTLDDLGRRVREDLQDWGGSAWVTRSFTGYEYSTRCHLDKILYPDGSAEEMAYDCEGKLVQEWDANHPRATNPPTKSLDYDALDRLVLQREPWGGTGGGTVDVTFGYDVQDHLTRVVDGNGTVTAYDYGDRGLMTKETSVSAWQTPPSKALCESP